MKSRLHKNENDVKVFNELDGDITILEGSIEFLRGELEGIVHKHGQLAKIKETLVDLRRNIIGNFSEDGQKSLKDGMEQITESLHSGKLMDNTDKDEIKNKINGLYTTGKSEKQNNKLAQGIFEELLNYMEKAGKTPVGQKGTQGGKTKFEKLYNTINHKIGGLENTDLANKGLQCNLGDVKSLLMYFDEFADEKKKIKEWQERERQLDGEKTKLSNDAELTHICRRLKVFESINKNYDVRSVMWLSAVLIEFLTKFQGEKDLGLKMKYLSSPIFLEFFTNIVAPLANDGNLKIALDIFDPNGNNSKNGADRICKFYQSLLNKDLNKNSNEDFIRKNIDSVFKDTVQLCVLIVFTKFNHHTNAFSKDLELIKSLTFGSVDPINLLVQGLANNNTDDKQNILQYIVENVFSGSSTVKEVFNYLKKLNPISTGIRGDCFNTGTTMFSTLNVIIRGAAVVADYKVHDGDDQNSMSKKVLGFFGGSGVRKAKGEIARLGKDVHKEVTEKFICEYLEMLRAGLNGRNYYPPQEPGDLPLTLLNVCHSQKFLKDYKEASQGRFPASLIASSDVEKLDGVQKKVGFGR